MSQNPSSHGDTPCIRLRTVLRAALMTTVFPLAACGALNRVLPAPAGTAEVLLLGEQHDQSDHQRQIGEQVQALVDQDRLGALVLEMADAGRDTAALTRIASEESVKAALAWDDDGWQWRRYGPIVMRAVRAGIPVIGGNVSRRDLRGAMAQAELDGQVPESARARLREAVEQGHCGLLPAAQLPAMARMQIARDRRLAETTLAARRTARGGQVVVLHAGAQHVATDRGVPLHLVALGVPPAQMHSVAFGDVDLPVDERRPALYEPQPDPCDELREQVTRKPGLLGRTAGDAPVAAPAAPAVPAAQAGASGPNR
jgi:uncharacterized iron-regulated protein